MGLPWKHWNERRCKSSAFKGVTDGRGNGAAEDLNGSWQKGVSMVFSVIGGPWNLLSPLGITQPIELHWSKGQTSAASKALP